MTAPRLGFYRYLESQIKGTASPGPGEPPGGLLAFYWHFLRQTRGWFALMLLIALFGLSSAAGMTFNPELILGVNVILTGSGGTPGGGYTLLSSTNVTAPLATWTTNVTGIFSGSGSFSNAIPVNPSETVRFFTIRIP